MRNPARTRRTAPAALLALALVLAACGDDDGQSGTSGGSDGSQPAPAKISLSLDWTPNPDHVALYWAEQHGLFANSGLTVAMQAPSDPSAPVKLVAAGRADLAITYEPEVFLVREQDAPVVAVASVIPVPLNTLIALPDSGIRSAADLRGRKLGITGIPADKAILDTMMQAKGLDASATEAIKVGYNLVPTLLSKKVDAILGGYRNIEAIQIEQQIKAKPVVIPLDDLGVPKYDELVLVANADKLKSDARYADAVRRFISTMVAGAEAARADTDTAVQVMEKATDYDRPFLEQSVPATTSLLVPEGGKIGCLDPERWQAYGDWMVANGLLKAKQNVSEVVSTEYHPGC
jgi:putative hydroxymethylpyrimidine transport system substrate-binding protein